MMPPLISSRLFYSWSIKKSNAVGCLFHLTSDGNYHMHNIPDENNWQCGVRFSVQLEMKHVNS